MKTGSVNKYSSVFEMFSVLNIPYRTMRFRETIFLWIFLSVCFAAKAQNVCTSKTTCSECIRVASCTWCSPTDLGKLGSASFPCNSRANNRQCDPGRLIDPQVSFTKIRDDPISRGRNGRKPIQLSPQEVEITNLRIGQVFNVTIQYTQAKDYPIDLYFLMDLSNSMNDDKANLENLGEKMAETMMSITSNFSLGFGSFVDKKTPPFAFTLEEKRNIFYPVEDQAYSFKHHLSLVNDSARFVSEVRKASIAVTRDAPEGGMDALLQAMVCSDIGWRNPSRRLLVFATDARSHLAGDGRLGGVVAPNDGHCHMRRNEYTKALEQDYPSVGLLARLAKKHAVNIIFAVVRESTQQYKVISELIRGSKVAILAKDSSNIVTLIKEQYESISSSVEMTSTAPDGIRIRFYTACMSQRVQENHQCLGLKVGDKVTFTASIEVLRCSVNKNERDFSFKIRPVGLNEELDVNLNVACDCSCETDPDEGFEADSEHCNRGGDLKCGVCDCDGFHSGQTCSCSSGQDQTTLMSECLSPNNMTCSNRGQCVCGQCECNERPNPDEKISGKFCECDNYSCTRNGGKICSGNGMCQCGQCNCYDGWSGSDCNCQSEDQCKALGDDRLCSGTGQCECGICKCSAGNKYCQVIDKEFCNDFHLCISCTLNRTSNLISEECVQNCTYPVTRNETIQDSLCTLYFYNNGESCQVPFIFNFNERNGQRLVQYGETKCYPVPVLAIVGGLTGFIVAAGIALLLAWRIITFLYDKKEYARFLDETKNAKWTADNNPLYVGASTTFQNPAFNKP